MNVILIFFSLKFWQEGKVIAYLSLKYIEKVK